MPSINFRKPARDAEPDDTATEENGSAVDVVEPDGRTTPKKDRATPKRSQARAARTTTTSFGPAANTKEGRTRERDQRRRAANEQREAMMSGDVSRMPPRERVPERVLARDIVDSRRNFGSLVLPALVIYIIGGLMPVAYVRLGAIYLMIVVIAGVLLDSFIVSRKVGNEVAQRYPDSRVKVKMYAVQRAMIIRKWRMPKPRVSPPK
jgi:hypothetical protein